jgi:hypothetical protein
MARSRFRAASSRICCFALLSCPVVQFPSCKKEQNQNSLLSCLCGSDDDDDVNGKFKLDDLYVVKVGAGSKQQFQYENGDIQCQFY